MPRKRRNVRVTITLKGLLHIAVSLIAAFVFWQAMATTLVLAGAYESGERHPWNSIATVILFTGYWLWRRYRSTWGAS